MGISSFASNSNTTVAPLQRAVAPTQTASTALQQVATAISIMETNIISGIGIPTTFQIQSVASVIAQLVSTNVDPSMIQIVQSVLNIISKYSGIYMTVNNLVSQLEHSNVKAKLLDDVNKLREYLLRKGTSIFPSQHVSVVPIEFDAALLIAISTYGLPLNVSKLAIIRQALQNQAMTMDGSLMNMLAAFTGLIVGI